MLITIENTEKIVELDIGGARVPARIWQGKTDSGIPVQCYVTRIAPEIPETHPDIDRLTSDFEAELRRVAKPRKTVEAIPLRVIL